MSKGLGKVQGAILRLIETASESFLEKAASGMVNPGWTTEGICESVFGIEFSEVTKKQHRVSVIRALKQMKLPEGWEYQWCGGKSKFLSYLPSGSAKSNREIARGLGVSSSTVAKVRKREQEAGKITSQDTSRENPKSFDGSPPQDLKYRSECFIYSVHNVVKRL
jgi:hypothetical protein